MLSRHSRWDLNDDDLDGIVSSSSIEIDISDDSDDICEILKARGMVREDLGGKRQKDGREEDRKTEDWDRRG
jgi:hypothetical protein